jgi:hypothetical protein
LHPVEQRGQQVFEVVCSVDSLLDIGVEMNGDLPIEFKVSGAGLAGCEFGFTTRVVNFLRVSFRR